ncbi:MAG: DHHA1 domain-containing protein, partial [Candidatus Taylorbacteria bacterium]|nr:DHHA1 domain-containing protein [Candidatus Taylorbacteria bacterium]
LDTGGLEMISNKGEIAFPDSLNTIVIDHHASNKGFGKMNLIDISSSSAAFVVFQLIKEWNVGLTRDMALNLFTGMYTDSGGFKYSPTDFRVLEAAAECAKVAPDYVDTIFTLENSSTKEALYFKALALNSVETFCNDSIAIASVSNEELTRKHITSEIISGSDIANALKAVIGWNIGILMTEIEPGKVKISMRSRDSKAYDVSLLAVSLGGGGHKAAAATCIKANIKEAKEQVVAKIKELYNL